MSNYIYLNRGSQLPAVAIAQKLLNAHGARLHIDGIFGRDMREAVVDWQTQRHLPPHGEIDQVTWQSLSSGFYLPIFDCLDVVDPYLRESSAADIARAAGDYVTVQEGRNGVVGAVNAILGCAPVNLFMLRFHGHGAPGWIGISVGRLRQGIEWTSVINYHNVVNMLPVLSRLRARMGPYTCVQFMGCSTGRGPNGHQLLDQLARNWGVPVSGALGGQYAGGFRTFRYETRTYTAMPHGMAIEAWADTLPALPIRV